MKNYYEILEVNKKASKEVIEKAYKVLVKKYHPDLNKNQKQVDSNKKIRDINEAYEVLSNDFLREQYNLELEKQEQNYININKNYKQNSKSEMQQNKVKQSVDTVEKHKVGTFLGIIELTKELFKSRAKREEVKEVTKKDLLALVLTIFVVILIGVILWFIPFTNGWMRELLFENALFNWIGRLFSK